MKASRFFEVPTHRLSNFIEAKNQALKLAGLLKNGLKMQDGNMNIDIGAILTNLGSPEMRSIEEFVLKQLTVIDENGDPVLIQDAAKFNAHFNRHRAHYFQMMFDGLKFHFADFLPAGVGICAVYESCRNDDPGLNPPSHVD